MSGMVQNQITDIDVTGSLDDIFNSCVSAGETVGNVTQKNKSMGFISVKTNRSWFPPCNPVSLRISVKAKDTTTCNISCSAQCIDGLVGVGSCGKAIDAFINALSDKCGS
jgi:hypothetical protein